MTTIPTQNAVPSEAARDLKFNAGKIDEFVTSLEREYKDRFGRCHMTIEGMRWIFEQLMERFKVDINHAIIAAGYIPVDSFQKGADITKRNEILRDEETGLYYRWDGDLPKSIPAGSTPENSGGVGYGAWVAIERTQDRIFYKTVSDMIGNKSIVPPMYVNTGSYFDGETGGATYRIMSIADARSFFEDQSWLPDNIIMKWSTKTGHRVRVFPEPSF
ncbi:hypothetical protein JW294_15985 [Morganella morganii]|uniref:tail fiber/spike domain-containing protein n=1 Tax=Morganella morganii TaxID=582 RepID=UPI001968318E|nr:hypothetical protein [Morganella morganii]QSB75845.1 hypothetical protein JW294_15985 [Morganella morganii]